jgi:hypothetical protein
VAAGEVRGRLRHPVAGIGPDGLVLGPCEGAEKGERLLQPVTLQGEEG